jgi:signal transduction histidine kinase
MHASPTFHLLGSDMLREAADALPALLFACSADGRQAWVNRQWLSYTGVADVRALGKRWEEITMPGDASPLRPRAGDGHDVETPFRLRDAHGAFRWQLARAHLTQAAAGGLWVGVVQELMPRPKTSDPRVDTDQFLALVAHELRSPLNAIRGWAQVLRKSGTVNAMQERALSTIDRNVAAQASLIDDLLDRQRLLQGRVELEKRRILLAGLIDDAVAALQPAAAQKQLRVSAHCPASIVIDADERRLRQVLANLLANAVKFTPAQGRIAVRVERAHGVVSIDVVDSGIGLSPEWVSRAFEPATEGAGPAGQGLGLTLAQRLVELHGGRLSASSDGPERGSTFRVELPAPSAGDADAPVTVPEAGAF